MLGVLLFIVGAFVMYQLIPHVRTRVDVWIDPFATPQTSGYQIIQALYAFGRGGLARDRAGCAVCRPSAAGSLAGSPRSTPTSRSRRSARSSG